jgi:hypothetical protein
MARANVPSNMRLEDHVRASGVSQKIKGSPLSPMPTTLAIANRRHDDEFASSIFLKPPVQQPLMQSIKFVFVTMPLQYD